MVAEAAAVLGASERVPGARLTRIDLAIERRGETLIVTGRSDSVRMER